MALQSSGAISLLDIQNEFGGSNPIGLNEYYGAGGAPSSGALSIANFYGLSSAVVLNPGAVYLYSYNALYYNSSYTTWQTIATKTFVHPANSTLRYRVRTEGISFPAGRSTGVATTSARWLKNGAVVVSVTSPSGGNNYSSIVSVDAATNTNDVLTLQRYQDTATAIVGAETLGQIGADQDPGGTLA